MYWDVNLNIHELITAAFQINAKMFSYEHKHISMTQGRLGKS